MKGLVRAGTAAALLTLAIPAQAAPVNFILDDGTSDIALGNFSGQEPVDVLVLNQFDAGAGASITEISYVFGTPGASVPTAAVPLQVVLFEDPNDDGGIADAVLLLAVDDTPTQIDNDVFNTVAVAPTFVAGSFFVGVFAAGIGNGQALVGGDTNSPLDRTFLFGGSALDLDDVLGSADVFSFDPDPFDDALIRAAGLTVPEPAGFGLLALAALALLSRRARPRCGHG